MDRIDAPARRHVAERHAMRRAIELARAGLGSTFGNPCVGAVILDPDLLVAGVGRTEPHGDLSGRHAEVVALAAAGERARGGTAVVTLEPCHGTGRTGPCTEALLAAGISRVVFAVSDPMPAYAGGAEALRDKGIDIATLMTADAHEVHRPWLTAVARQRPYVTLKLAASLDGRVAASDGTSRWVTGPDARQDGHRLRGEVGAIVVGSGTVLADDPALTARGTDEPREPLRVVLDRRGRTPVDAQVRPALVTADPPADVLAHLYGREVRHVLVEGGPTVAGAFLAAGLVDEVVAYLAPVLLGAGPNALETTAFPGIADAVRLELTDVRQLGTDVRLTALVKETR